MKPFLLAAILLGAASYAYAGDPLAALRNALAASERAHRTHSTAIRLCGFEAEDEIGWDHIERQTRELANAPQTPAASRMVNVLFSLRLERRSLFGDFVQCSSKLNRTKTAESIIDAMTSLDEASGDVEGSIRERAWNLEQGAEWYKAHPCAK